MTVTILGLTIHVDDFVTIFETFNLVTVVTGIVTGAMFGFFAFLPLVRLLAPDGPPPQTARQAFAYTLVVLFIVLGAVLTVFYAEQIVTEVVVRGQLSMRAVGRYLAFLVFLLAFSVGVGYAVFREFRSRESDTVGDVQEHAKEIE